MNSTFHTQLSSTSQQSAKLSITLRQEQLSKFWPDAEPLFRFHWRELCVNPEKLKIDIDKPRYAQLEALRMLYVLTARRGQAGRLIGYLMAFILPHFHYKSSGEVAATDMYWVNPKERTGVGLKLFLRFEEDMKARGVVQIITSCKTHQDHSALLKLLDWQHTDNTFCKFP
jgi:hypothetical protein